MTDRDRGAGRLSGAFARGRRSGGGAGGASGAGGGAAAGGTAAGAAPTTAPPRRRRRQKFGKRSRPEKYAQATGYVRHEVVGRRDQAFADPEVRRGLEAELSRSGVEFKPGDPDYGALCEMLVMEWLESVGYGLGEARP